MVDYDSSVDSVVDAVGFDWVVIADSAVVAAVADSDSEVLVDSTVVVAHSGFDSDFVVLAD